MQEERALSLIDNVIKNNLEQEIHNMHRQAHYATIPISKVSEGVFERFGVRTTRVHTRQDIRNYVSDPLRNKDALQEVSLFLLGLSGNYFRILDYLSGLFTYDTYLYAKEPDVTHDKYIDACYHLDRMNLKKNMPAFMKRLMQNGELYLYKVENENHISYIEFPPSLCRIAIKENSYYRFDFNVLQLDDNVIDSYPKEIQDAYHNGTGDRTEDGWYRVSDNGVAFNAQGDYVNGYPVFSFIFDDIMGLENIKELMEDKTVVEAIKLIHLKIPLNKNDVPIINDGVARTYHQDTVDAVPDNVGVVTTPLDMDAVSFDASKPKEMDAIKRSESNIWSNVGISPLLFGDSTTSGEAVKRSITTDEMLAFKLIQLFEGYFEDELSEYGVGLEILPVTFHNREDMARLYKEQVLELGSSRLKALAATGMTPLQIINMYNLEQNILDIDSMLPVRETSYTLTDKEGGRPTNEEIGKDDADSTEVVRDNS